MKHVTFIKPMAPYPAGGRLLVPDEVAARLEAEGAIEPNPPYWPHPPVIPAKRRRGFYLTKAN